MKQIVFFLALVLFSCKGQNADTLIEIKSNKPNRTEIIAQKSNSEELTVFFYIPKTYVIKSNKELKLVDIIYYKHPNNNFGSSGLIVGKEFLNLNDTINFDIVYDGILNKRDLRKIINNQIIEEKRIYPITNNQVLSELLKVFKKDEILFKYRHEDNPKELQVLSIPVNLE